MRIFSFERDVVQALELVPLTVRRKLDLAGVKVSLQAWQALSVDDRRALFTTEAEDEPSVSAFADLVRRSAARAGGSTTALAPAPPAWRTADVPPAVRARILELGATLGDAAWRSLDDDARFTIVHLARDRRRDDRLRAALVELGFLLV